MNPTIKALEFSLYPGEPFNAAQAVRDFLVTVEADPILIPTTWGPAERQRLEYRKEDILARAAGEKFAGVVYIHRNKAIKYDGSVDIGPFRYIGFSFDKALAESQWPALLSLSDRLAAAIKTRFAVFHIFRAVPFPWTSEEDKLRRLMNVAAYPVPSVFRKNGPLGLGLRTIFGGDIIDLFGRERLLSTPARVSELPWGGIQIDLAKDLWNIEPETLAQTWKAAMDHLAPAQAFAVPVFREGREAIMFTPSPAWSAKIKARSSAGRKGT